MRFFAGIKTVEELKKAYRKLALVHHPDRGGNEKDFIALKDEYDRLFAQLSRQQQRTAGSERTRENRENTKQSTEREYDHAAAAKAFRDIIDQLINYDIEIEIIGTWIWVSGNTYSIKGELKKLGFSWGSKKKMWYWHEGEYVKTCKKNFTMDELRNMHGSEKVKTNKQAKLNA